MSKSRIMFENINTEVEKTIKSDKKAEGAEKEKKDPKGGRIMIIESRKYNQNSTKSDSSDSDTDSDEKTDPSSTMIETVPQKPSKTVDMKQHLSSTVLHGHSKKRSPVVPDGISPIQASKSKSKAQAPLKLFDKVFRNESRDGENDTSRDISDKEKKPKKKRKKKNKVAGFLT